MRQTCPFCKSDIDYYAVICPPALVTHETFDPSLVIRLRWSNVTSHSRLASSQMAALAY